MRADRICEYLISTDCLWISDTHRFNTDLKFKRFYV